MGGVLRLRAWLWLLAERGEAVAGEARALAQMKQEEEDQEPSYPRGVPEDLWICGAAPQAPPVEIPIFLESGASPHQVEERGLAPDPAPPCGETQQARAVEIPVGSREEEEEVAPWRALKRRRRQGGAPAQCEEEEALVRDGAQGGVGDVSLPEKDRETVEMLRQLLVGPSPE